MNWNKLEVWFQIVFTDICLINWCSNDNGLIQFQSHQRISFQGDLTNNLRWINEITVTTNNFQIIPPYILCKTVKKLTYIMRLRSNLSSTINLFNLYRTEMGDVVIQATTKMIIKHMCFAMLLASLRNVCNANQSLSWQTWQKQVLRLFVWLFVQSDIKGSTKGPHHWPMWEEATWDWWIPCNAESVYAYIQNAKHWPQEHVMLILNCNLRIPVAGEVHEHFSEISLRWCHTKKYALVLVMAWCRHCVLTCFCFCTSSS